MRRARSQPTNPLASLAPMVVGLALLVACSPARPSLVPTSTAAQDPTGTATVPAPDRSDCETAVGAGPGSLTLATHSETASIPCVVVAAHHRLAVVNDSGQPIEVTVGSATLTLALGAREVTAPAAEVLAPGLNRLQAGPDTVGFAWMVTPADHPLVEASIGLASIGDVELGQGPAQVTAAAGLPVPAAGSPCYQAQLRGDPYSPVFTFRDGSLVVVQIFTPGLATLSGISIGATSADIAAAYGDRVSALPAPDGDPARQLMVFTPTDEDDQVHRLVFDLTDDRVTTMRFGAAEIVATSPGC